MTYRYTDRDGDEITVQSVPYDGVPHAALGVQTSRGPAAVHVHPDDAWEMCEAILSAAGVDRAKP
ncbi:hypothetical protein [Spongiactinospora gelatinilytica]|uniref:hypothetical protein n=1 Tax=Spongiactinospora gelatinilytica TaxID=2666298 RepID=UPI0018F782C3|nr:hypothetical protein [Spongiactinospora gelatinilytica]